MFCTINITAHMPQGDSVVLFVDMLGFASLLEQTPDAVSKLKPIFQPMTSIESVVSGIVADQDPLVARFTSFHIALEKRIQADIKGGVTAITFSDSAFVHLPSALGVIRFGRMLM